MPTEQITQVHHADHLVQVAGMHHRSPRVAGVDQHRLRLGHGHVASEFDHGPARNQDLAQYPIMDVQCAGDHVALFGGEPALHGNQFPQLIRRELLGRGVRVPAEQPDQHIGGPPQEPDHRFGQGRQPIQRYGDQ